MAKSTEAVATNNTYGNLSRCEKVSVSGIRPNKMNAANALTAARQGELTSPVAS
jgi:hypothetical protein